MIPPSFQGYWQKRCCLHSSCLWKTFWSWLWYYWDQQVSEQSKSHNSCSW